MSTPFYRRWVRSFKRRIADLTWTEGFRIIRRDGALFLLDHRNYVDRQLALGGGHERGQLGYLLGQMRERGCDVFLDVGANFGLYSVLVAKHGGSSQVLGFEPDARNHGQFHANLYLNRLTADVRVYCVALSDRSGRLPFTRAAATTTGQSRLCEGGLETVEAARLDDLLILAGKRVFIKIDIEGHELAALAGMARLLRENNCFLQVECFGAQLGKLTRMLSLAGYDHVHRIGDDQYFAKTAVAIPPGRAVTSSPQDIGAPAPFLPRQQADRRHRRPRDRRR